MANTAVSSASATVSGKAKKPAASKKPKAPRAYPSFYEMISDAIVTLKERTGSSQYAITKFIEEKHKKLPSNFRKLLLVQLKKLVASGKLVKVKNSFKLPPSKKPDAVKPKVVSKTKPKAELAAKPKSKTAAKTKMAAKATMKPKPKKKAAAKPAKTVTRASPGKKAAASKKSMRKPKTVKTATKKAKK